MNEYDKFVRIIDEINLVSRNIKILSEKILMANMVQNVMDGVSGHWRVTQDFLSRILMADFVEYNLIDMIYDYNMSAILTSKFNISLYGMNDYISFSMSNGDWPNSNIMIDPKEECYIKPFYHDKIFYSKKRIDTGFYEIIDSEILKENGIEKLPQESSLWNEEIYFLLKMTI